MIALLQPLAWLSASFAALFAIAELLHRAGHVQAEHTRKLVHAGTGLLTLLFPVFLSQVWQVGLLCGSFLVLLVASKSGGWLPSINDVPRKTAGSWLYPVIVFVCFCFYKHMAQGPGILFKPLYYFCTPLLLLAFCDPAAALAGAAWKRTHPHIRPGKTFAGSCSFFVAACIICIGAALVFTKHLWPSGLYLATAIVIAFVTTLAERFSDKGWDNFTIPAAAMLCLFFIDRAV